LVSTRTLQVALIFIQLRGHW